MSEQSSMDVIDQRQQKEIHILAAGMTFLLVLFIITLVLLANREISCPHKECPHFLIQK